MVADTAITGGKFQLRQRIYQIKIVPSRDGRGLVGFAGDEHYGRKLVERAASLRSGTEVVEMLTEAHQEHRSVDFAYGYINEAGPQLIRIADGSAEEVPTFYLGVADAFEHFQRIRHDPKIDPAPEAIHTFVCGSRSSEPVPSPLSTAITSMLRLFTERAERDVGGWPVAYFLTAEGAFFCGYGYAVSDPILKTISAGSVVPHGSAQAGGFGLSVTEYGLGEGMVVYWLQQPGGMVFRRSCEAYELHEFHGTPSRFKQSVCEALGKEIDLLFGDKLPGPTRAIAVMRDELGNSGNRNRKTQRQLFDLCAECDNSISSGVLNEFEND